jgi:hypothetical protein
MRNRPDASLFAPDEPLIGNKINETPSIGSYVVAFVTLPVTAAVCALSVQAQSSQPAIFNATMLAFPLTSLLAAAGHRYTRVALERGC